ncbi:MAG TPA: hypothetical protein VLL54_16410 [Pyrinomonadaceae bacterium]|nr:hypothetical protein [Pyrinomonadaceae bacterium]
MKVNGSEGLRKKVAANIKEIGSERSSPSLAPQRASLLTGIAGVPPAVERELLF